MHKVNIDKVGTLTGEIRTALKNLESYALLSEKEAIDNPTVLGSIKYNLIVAIQGCINDLGDIKDFLKQIGHYLRKKENKP